MRSKKLNLVGFKVYVQNLIVVLLSMNDIVTHSPDLGHHLSFGCKDSTEPSNVVRSKEDKQSECVQGNEGDQK